MEIGYFSAESVASINQMETRASITNYRVIGKGHTNKSFQSLSYNCWRQNKILLLRRVEFTTEFGIYYTDNRESLSIQVMHFRFPNNYLHIHQQMERAFSSNV